MTRTINLFGAHITPDKKVRLVDLADTPPRNTIPLSGVFAPGDPRQLLAKVGSRLGEREEVEGMIGAMLAEHWTDLVGQFEGRPLVLKPRWDAHRVHEMPSTLGHIREFGHSGCLLGHARLGLETRAISFDPESAKRHAYDLNSQVQTLEGNLLNWPDVIDLTPGLEWLLGGDSVVTLVSPRSF